jgi:hypothetical protein
MFTNTRFVPLCIEPPSYSDAVYFRNTLNIHASSHLPTASSHYHGRMFYVLNRNTRSPYRMLIKDQIPLQTVRLPSATKSTHTSN